MKFLLLFVSMLAITATGFGLNPSRTYAQKPDNYEEIKVKSNDGKAELVSWYIPSAAGVKAPLLLVCHNGEGNMADHLNRVDALRAKYRVVIFDYRGYGESSEFEIDNNMYIYPHFQDDVQSMIDHCRKTYGPNFGIHGFGIGGGLALGIGWNRLEISHIIADTPFFSMEDLEERFGSWDEPMEVPFAGYEKRFEPMHALLSPPKKSLQGVKIIVGSNDILYSIDDMKKLQGLLKEHKFTNKIYVIENPDRKDNFQRDVSGYVTAVSEVMP